VSSYEIDGQILTLRVSASLTPSEREALFDAVRVDARVPQAVVLIIDARSLPLDLSEASLIEWLRALVDRLGPKLGSMCAMIREAHGDNSHLFQTAARSLGLRVGLFSDEQTARQWFEHSK
jgi:uncharacterized protein (DUF2336 family)